MVSLFFCAWHGISKIQTHFVEQTCVFAITLEILDAWHNWKETITE